MDLIQALKKADGRPVKRPCWLDGKNIFDDGLDIVTESGADIILNSADMLADDWYVVESLDDVIEREVAIVMESKGGAYKLHENVVNAAIRRVLAWQAENGK